LELEGKKAKRASSSKYNEVARRRTEIDEYFTFPAFLFLIPLEKRQGGEEGGPIAIYTLFILP